MDIQGTKDLEKSVNKERLSFNVSGENINELIDLD
jgi:hypothetical protein